MTNHTLTADYMRTFEIKVYEPFAEYLGGNEAESRFSISLLDAYHLAGHSCPSMTGAFLMTAAAAKSLFSDGILVRGMVEVDIASDPGSGATGPMANVIAYITGAWGDSGFGGLGGKFRRRDLLRFNSENAPDGGFRFTRSDTGKVIDVFFSPGPPSPESAAAPFPETWRIRVRQILEQGDASVKIVTVRD